MLRYGTAMVTCLSLSYTLYKLPDVTRDAFLKLPLTGIVYDENAERTEQILF